MYIACIVLVCTETFTAPPHPSSDWSKQGGEKHRAIFDAPWGMAKVLSLPKLHSKSSSGRHAAALTVTSVPPLDGPWLGANGTIAWPAKSSMLIMLPLEVKSTPLLLTSNV